MELSLFLAKVIGIVMMLVSVSLLFNKKSVALLFSIYSHTSAVFLTGLLEVVLGLMLVLTHNIWTFDFRGVITLMGWILLIRGLARLFFPSKIIVWANKFRRMQSVLKTLLIFVFLIGAYLTYMGFTK